MPTVKYRIDVDMGSAEGDRTDVFFVEHRGDDSDLRGVTGGLVLVPMIATCAADHVTRTLVSPSVVMHSTREAWQKVKCAHCKRTVTLKADYARMNGKP